jgi:hypothetical protein
LTALGKIDLYRTSNRLSVHDAKLIDIKNIVLNYHNYRKETRLTNNHIAEELTTYLRHEIW